MSIKLNRKGAGLAGEDRVKENQNLEMIEQEFGRMDAVKEDSAAARLSALEALAKADAADSLSKNVQTQLNTIVVSGDSSPQATQASVGARGEDYGGNLKARLDAEFNETAAQLAETSNNLSDIAVYARDFGVKGDGVTDDAAAIAAALNFANGRTVMLPNGTTRISSPINYSGEVNLKGAGNASVLDLSSGGSFNFSSALTAISSLANNIKKGASTITFSTAHGLSEGDAFIVYNPTQFSWSSFRSYYHDGCMFKVEQVVSSTQVKIYGVSPDSYVSADMQVFKINGKGVNLSDFKVKPSATGNVQVWVDGHQGVNLHNIEMPKGAMYTGFEIWRCFDVNIDSLRCEVSSGDAYPVSISNSQKVTISRCPLYSVRHCIALGGRSGNGCVPTRNILVDQCILLNRSSNGIGAADIHGNCENVVYSDCVLNTGANMAGKNVKYVNCTIYGRDPDAFVDGNCIFGSEVAGGVFSIESCRLITDGDGASFGTIHLDVRGRKDDVLISVKDTVIQNSNGFTSVRAVAINVGNDSPSTKRLDIEIDGLRTTNKIFAFLMIVGTNDISGVSSYIVDNIFTPIGASFVGASNVANYNVPMRLQRQTGVQELTAAVSTASTVGTSQTYKYKYPKQPHAQVSAGSNVDRILNGNKILIPGLYRVNETLIRPYISTGDTTQWTNTVVTNVMWEVGISEV